MMKKSFAGLRGSCLCIAAGTLAAGCGGGGSTASPQQGSGSALSLSSAAAGTASYGKTLTLTLAGTNLDQDLSVSATGCDGVTIDTSSSGPSTAIYECAVSAVGAGLFTVKRTSTGATLTTVAFTVPAPQVTMNFSNGAGVAGAIVFTLAPDKAPVTVNNFLSYVNSGFYAGTVFHRVSPGFVVQGGGYSAPLDASDQTLKSTGAPIALEVGTGLSNTQWTVAMARGDGSATATSQFFINLVDNSASLDPSALTAGYAVFGSVAGSAADVMAIVGAPCTAIPLFLPTGECTPMPNMQITSALQTQ